jgi:periplasmic protein TonB
MLIDLLYRTRSWLAGMPSLIFIALALFWTSQVAPLKLKPKPNPPMQLRMVELPPPAPVIQPQPKPVTPPHPEPVRPVPPKAVPAPSPAPTIPTAIAAPVAAPPVPSVGATVAPPQPAPQPQPKHVADTPPPPPVPVNNNAADGYIAKLRAYIDSSKRYPTGREASLMRPAGMVRIWLELDRNGHLLDSGIEQSSHSMLLDHAALSTVRRGEYPSFPADVWPGGNSHRFTVDINYTPAS